MIVKIENTETMGWQGALRGMRNPKNSWERSDTKYVFSESDDGILGVVPSIGPNDLKLAKTLISGGPVHRKFLRSIFVTADFTMPIYLTPEFDTYKVGTVRDSCSFMHKGVEKEFKTEDFVLDDLDDCQEILGARDEIIKAINQLRSKYLETKDIKYFRAIRQLVPQGHNIKFTWSGNYEILLGMYKWRKNHRLSEWHEICSWIEGLPYMDEFLDAANQK